MRVERPRNGQVSLGHEQGFHTGRPRCRTGADILASERVRTSWLGADANQSPLDKASEGMPYCYAFDRTLVFTSSPGEHFRASEVWILDLKRPAAFAASIVFACALSACGGRGSSVPNAGNIRTTATVGRATGSHLATIVRRRSTGLRSAQVEQVVAEGGSGGGGSGSATGHNTCTGGCTGGTYTAVPGGRQFNVGVTAPNAGNYVITGYTVNNGIQTPIPSYTVSVSFDQAGPYQEVNASVFIGSNVQMDGGISITVTGPLGVDDWTLPTCDTGTGTWDYDPAAP